MKSTQRITAFILCLIMILSCIQTVVFADSAELQSTNISNVNLKLTISGINSTSNARLEATRSMSLSIKMELQKLKSGTYTTVETWSSSKTGVSLSMTETRLINALATYRLKVTFTAGSETIIRYAYS